jgi:hypothetical protein
MSSDVYMNEQILINISTYVSVACPYGLRSTIPRSTWQHASGYSERCRSEIQLTIYAVPIAGFLTRCYYSTRMDTWYKNESFFVTFLEVVLSHAVSERRLDIRFTHFQADFGDKQPSSLDAIHKKCIKYEHKYNSLLRLLQVQS